MVIQGLLQSRSLYPYSRQEDGVAGGSFRELHLLLFLREVEADTEARSLLKPTSLTSAAVATPRHAGTGEGTCAVPASIEGDAQRKGNGKALTC